MIDLDIINGTIAEWESKDLTFFTVERLAWLYIVRDHILMNKSTDQPDADKVVYMPSVAISSGSEFMNAAEQADVNHLWKTMDELMDALKIMNPRLYDSTLRMLRE